MTAPTYTVDTCSSDKCAAQIIWCETERGERMPVDAEPVADGNVALRARAGQPPLAIVLRNVADRFGKAMRRSHFSTCVDAARFRRSR